MESILFTVIFFVPVSSTRRALYLRHPATVFLVEPGSSLANQTTEICEKRNFDYWEMKTM